MIISLLLDKVENRNKVPIWNNECYHVFPRVQPLETVQREAARHLLYFWHSANKGWLHRIRHRHDSGHGQNTCPTLSSSCPDLCTPCLKNRTWFWQKRGRLLYKVCFLPHSFTFASESQAVRVVVLQVKTI